MGKTLTPDDLAAIRARAETFHVTWFGQDQAPPFSQLRWSGATQEDIYLLFSPTWTP